MISVPGGWRHASRLRGCISSSEQYKKIDGFGLLRQQSNPGRLSALAFPSPGSDGAIGGLHVLPFEGRRSPGTSCRLASQAPTTKPASRALSPATRRLRRGGRSPSPTSGQAIWSEQQATLRSRARRKLLKSCCEVFSLWPALNPIRPRENEPERSFGRRKFFSGFKWDIKVLARQ